MHALIVSKKLVARGRIKGLNKKTARTAASWQYPRTDSNRALRLRRPTLCPLSYGGECEANFTIGEEKG